MKRPHCPTYLATNTFMVLAGTARLSVSFAGFSRPGGQLKPSVSNARYQFIWAGMMGRVKVWSSQWALTAM